MENIASFLKITLYCYCYISYIILADIFKEMLSVSCIMYKVLQICFITYIFQLIESHLSKCK